MRILKWLARAIGVALPATVFAPHLAFMELPWVHGVAPRFPKATRGRPTRPCIGSIP